MVSKKKVTKWAKQVNSKKSSTQARSKILDADARSKQLPPHTPNVIVMAHPSLYKHPFTRVTENDEFESRANNFARVYDSLFKKRH